MIRVIGHCLESVGVWFRNSISQEPFFEPSLTCKGLEIYLLPCLLNLQRAPWPLPVSGNWGPRLNCCNQRKIRLLRPRLQQKHQPLRQRNPLRQRPKHQRWQQHNQQQHQQQLRQLSQQHRRQQLRPLNQQQQHQSQKHQPRQLHHQQQQELQQLQLNPLRQQPKHHQLWQLNPLHRRKHRHSPRQLITRHRQRRYACPHRRLVEGMADSTRDVAALHRN